MRIGWFEAMMTPAEVMLQDLEFMELEKTYGEKKQDNKKNK